MPLTRYPGMCDVKKVKATDDELSLKYQRKTEMARLLFQSLYGAGENTKYWDQFIIMPSGMPVKITALAESNQTKNNMRDAQGGAEILASYFDKYPGRSLLIFLPDKQLHELRYNSAADVYEINTDPIPPAKTDKMREGFEKFCEQKKEQFKICEQSHTFKQDIKSAQEAIDIEYKANYEQRVIEAEKNPKPVAAENPKPKAVSIIRPGFVGTFPSKIPDGNGGYSSKMAAEEFLTALYGKNPENRKDAIITADFKAFGDQDVAGNLAEYFEKNPFGKLLIYSPSDNKMHELRLSLDGIFTIERMEYEPYSVTQSERTKFNDTLKINQEKYRLVLSGDNQKIYQAETSASKKIGKDNIDAVRSLPITVSKPAFVQNLTEVERADDNFWKEATAVYHDLDNAVYLIIDSCNSNKLSEKQQSELTDIKSLVKKVRDVYAQIVFQNFDMIFGDSDIYRVNTRLAAEKIESFLINNNLSNDKATVDALKKVQTILTDPSGVIAQVQRGLDIFDNVPKNYKLNGLQEYGTGLSTQDAYFGQAPSVEELQAMDAAKTDPQKLISVLIWGAGQELMSDNLLSDEEFASQNLYRLQFNRYRQQIDRLFDQFDKKGTLPFDTITEYASMFVGAQSELAHRVYNIYNHAKETAPENQDQESYACKVMSESDEFLAFKALESKLNIVGNDTIFGKLLRKFRVQMLENPLFNGTEKQKMFQFERSIIAENIDEFYKKRGYEPEAKFLQSAKEKENLKAKLAQSGFDENVNKDLADACNDLMKDNEKASDSFKAMRNTMYRFANVAGANLSDEKARFEYEAKLFAAEKAASEYYKSHNRFHITDNGDKRFNISGRLVTHLGDLKKSLAEYKKNQPVSGYEVKMAFKQQLENLNSKKIDANQFKKNVQAWAKPLLAANLQLMPDEMKAINDKYITEAFENLDMEDFKALADEKTDIRSFDKISVLYGYISRNDVTSQRFKDNEKIQELSSTLNERIQKCGNDLRQALLNGEKDELDKKLASLAYVTVLKQKLENRDEIPEKIKKAMSGEIANQDFDKLIEITRGFLKEMPEQNLKDVAEMPNFNRIITDALQSYSDNLKAEVNEPVKQQRGLNI